MLRDFRILAPYRITKLLDDEFISIYVQLL